MRKLKSLKIDDREISVQELTAGQVGTLLLNYDAQREAHVAELLMDSTIPMDVVVLSAGLTEAELNELPPSELKKIWDAVGEVNNFLSALLAKALTAAANRAMKPLPAPPAG